jgi:hypothetical protein
MQEAQTRKELKDFFYYPLHIAAALHKMSICDFKRMYNEKGIKRWPYNKYKNKRRTSMGGFEDFQIYLETPSIKQTSSPTSTEEIENREKVQEFQDFCHSLDEKDFEFNYLFENYLF